MSGKVTHITPDLRISGMHGNVSVRHTGCNAEVVIGLEKAWCEEGHCFDVAQVKDLLVASNKSITAALTEINRMRKGKPIKEKKPQESATVYNLADYRKT